MTRAEPNARDAGPAHRAAQQKTRCAAQCGRMKARNEQKMQKGSGGRVTDAVATNATVPYEL